MTSPRYPLAVFVSYCRSDRLLAEKLVQSLEHVNLVPIWDRDFTPGTSFTGAIKETIASAHPFIPLITPASTERQWVHQETGFAVGLGRNSGASISSRSCSDCLSPSTSDVIDSPEERTALLIHHAQRVLDRGEHGPVRQRGIFSSFSLPPPDPREAIWD